MEAASRHPLGTRQSDHRFTAASVTCDNSRSSPAPFFALTGRKARIAGLIVLWLVVAPVQALLAEDIPRVRTVDPSVRALIGRGAELSPTLRRLISEVQGSDLIVYVERHGRFGNRDAGSFRMISGCGDQRYARIAISSKLPFREAIIVLGHELQHAVEVASAAYVVDQKGMQELYCRIGDRFAENYDTVAARLVTHQVSEELSLRTDR
jgi:hypothetical protein